MLLTWTTRALFESGASDAPWDQGTNMTSTEAEGYFTGEIIGMKTFDGTGASRLVGQNVGYSLLVAVLIFLALANSKLTHLRLLFIISCHL